MCLLMYVLTPSPSPFRASVCFSKKKEKEKKEREIRIERKRHRVHLLARSLFFHMYVTVDSVSGSLTHTRSDTDA